MPNPKRPKPASEASNYAHPAADLALRPEVGTQAQFKKHKAPQTYRYDSSLSPALEWDGQNPAREEGERCIVALSECAARIAETAQRPPSAQRDADLAGLLSEIHALQARLQGLSRPFLNWTGKAERLSFDVPTLPLFVTPLRYTWNTSRHRCPPPRWTPCVASISAGHDLLYPRTDRGVCGF